MYEQVILEPYELLQYFTLKQDLEIQHKQVDLFQLELQNLVQPSNTHILAALVILKQPFPIVITKLKQCTEDQLQVRHYHIDYLFFLGSIIDSFECSCSIFISY